MNPKIWLNGSELTGRKSDSSPVLANCEVEWGAETDIEHQSAASLTFQILFKSGSQDIVGLQHGAEVELTYDKSTVFAGIVKSATAVSHKLGLLVTVNCNEHLAELEGMFTQTEWIWSVASVRWQLIRDLFESKGWQLEPAIFSRSYLESNMYYSSIKVLTILERFLAANGALTRWDASYRQRGELVKRVYAGRRGTSSSPNKLRTENGQWVVLYWADSTTGVITWLDGYNMVRSPWKLEAGTAVNSIQLSRQETRTDPETNEKTTELVEAVRNDTASIRENGVQSVEVTTSASSGDVPAMLDDIASSWYRPDAGWVLDDVEIHDSNQVTHERMIRLLDNSQRTQNLVIIRGVFGSTPNDTASNVRASLIGGTYLWNGDEWEIVLKLGRNQDFVASNQWTFSDVAASSNPDISGGTADSIGRQISFADFKQISKD